MPHWEYLRIVRHWRCPDRTISLLQAPARPRRGLSFRSRNAESWRTPTPTQARVALIQLHRSRGRQCVPLRAKPVSRFFRDHVQRERRSPSAQRQVCRSLEHFSPFLRCLQERIEALNFFSPHRRMGVSRELASFSDAAKSELGCCCGAVAEQSRYSPASPAAEIEPIVSVCTSQ